MHYLVKLRKLMMRDLTHAELFHGGDAESKLVAESLAATLQRIQDFEDCVEYETASEAGSANLSLPTHDSGNLEKKDSAHIGINGEINGDENDTDVINRRDQEAFFTPANSNIVDDSDEDHGADSSPLEDNTTDDCLDDVKTTKIANAQVLRMQPRLMRVISFSQERCLDLWNSKSEPHYRNAVFISMMQGAKKENRGKQEGNQQNQASPLTEAQIQLYEDLVRLRAYVARRVECLPGFICSMDDLAHLAAGRPTNIEALRVINYFLPEILRAANDEAGASGDAFLKQIFILTQKSLKMHGIGVSPFDAAVKRFYAEEGDSSDNQGGWSVVWKVLLASAVCGGIFIVAVSLTRRRRK